MPFGTFLSSHESLCTYQSRHWCDNSMRHGARNMDNPPRYIYLDWSGACTTIIQVALPWRKIVSTSVLWTTTAEPWPMPNERCINREGHRVRVTPGGNLFVRFAANPAVKKGKMKPRKNSLRSRYCHGYFMPRLRLVSMALALRM